MATTRDSSHGLAFCTRFITATSDRQAIPFRWAHRPTKRNDQSQTQYANTRRSKSVACLTSRQRCNAFVSRAVRSRSTGRARRASAHTSSSKGWPGARDVPPPCPTCNAAKPWSLPTVSSVFCSEIASIGPLGPISHNLQIPKSARMGRLSPPRSPADDLQEQRVNLTKKRVFCIIRAT
jgi:hypothetical protein